MSRQGALANVTHQIAFQTPFRQLCCTKCGRRFSFPFLPMSPRSKEWGPRLPPWSRNWPGRWSATWSSWARRASSSVDAPRLRKRSRARSACSTWSSIACLFLQSPALRSRSGPRTRPASSIWSGSAARPSTSTASCPAANDASSPARSSGSTTRSRSSTRTGSCRWTRPRRSLRSSLSIPRLPAFHRASCESWPSEP